jgi:hypothetical protein
MATEIQPAGWVTDSGEGPYATEAEALISELWEWAEQEATKYRTEGWAAHNRKEHIKEATYIGREWAFMSFQYRLRELLTRIEQDIPLGSRGVNNEREVKDVL